MHKEENSIKLKFMSNAMSVEDNGVKMTHKKTYGLEDGSKDKRKCTYIV